MGVIWDLNHFDPPDDAVAHARRAAEAADPSEAFWICPVNEPALYPVLCGMSHHDAVDLALTMARVAKDHHPDVRILSTDPITGIGERQFAATDALVSAGLVDVVGVNLLPAHGPHVAAQGVGQSRAPVRAADLGRRDELA